MTYQTALELIGYFASILILTSLLMGSAVKLRVLNGIGALVFTVYGILIGSYPTAFLNGVSALVDVYFVVKLLRDKTQFVGHMVKLEETGLQEFLRFYRNDIGHHFPTYDFQISKEDLIFLVYADANPVGLLIGKRLDASSLLVKLDYSIPKFRDCSVGQFLYNELAQGGITRLVTQGGTQEHEAYLKKVGFVPENDQFVRHLK